MYSLQPSGYHPKESNWQNYRHFTSVSVPGSVRRWLLDSGSLTQRLIKSSGGQFKVQVLSQQWQRPRLSEATLLGIPTREMAIIREVALLCAGKPRVFARSVIPASSLVGRLRRLRKFNDSSLGEMLFRDTSMRRHPFQIAAIAGNDSQLPADLQQSGTLWGRRCRFELAARPIMVSEIFLDNA
ncbi:chorismate lyase [uncultured Oceanicoccus sp.]|uniref:chorismate--pyruvate lyase family protein n=1 Tax=uncultured Oceanicoccus sp. TaxID=1706381 RepID=UPI0030DAA14C